MNSDMDLLNKPGALGNLNPDHVQGILSLSSNDQSFIDHHQQPLSILNFNDNNFQAPLFYEPITPFLPSAAGPCNIQDTGVKTISETDYENAKKNYRFCGKKRKRSNEREVEKPKEVVHVRAKRGQATDSHSLAERLRREKINEKLRGLQDLVPGCYKTMGMAVMLDVIINYVRSLQNQIEFLSMKLSVASLFYDFNSETDGMETLQGTTGYEAQGMELGEGYGGFSYFPSAWPQT